MSPSTSENSIYHAVVNGLQDTSIEIPAPGHEKYLERIVRWSEAAEKKASAVVLPVSSDEVSSIVKLLRRENIEFVVAGGRHSTAGASSIEDGVVIDLCKMNSVRVNEENKTLVVQGGCVWKDVDETAAKYGLATVGGTVNHTGVGGLTLGGGFGWLSPKYGLTIDNLLSAELVLADGTVMRASKDENADLFWAIRGCGSSFAIATEFTFQAYDEPNPAWGGLMAFSPDRMEEVVNFGNKFHTIATDQAFILGCANPPPHHKPAIVTVLFYNGPEEEARKFYSDLIAIGPIVEKTRMMPYCQVNAMINPLTDYGGRKTMGSSAFKYPLDVNLVRDVFNNHSKLVTEHEEINGSISMFFFFPHHKVLEVSLEDTAYANRGDYYHFESMTRWVSPELDQICRDYARNLSKTIKERGGVRNERGVGAYANTVEQQIDAKAIFGVNTERLKLLKKQYDPDNMFRRWHDVFHVDKA